MAFDFKLPDLGEGVSEGEIVRWLVDVGDLVEPEQPLVEVMTDKVTAELPAPVGGRVTRLAGRVGDVVAVGTPLVCIDTGAAEEAAGEAPLAPSAPPAAMSAPAAPEAGTPDAPPLAVPAVRRLARELGVELAEVAGSGPGGRILEEDVRAAVPPPDGVRTAPEAEEAAWDQGGIRRVPLRGMRRAIAEHLLDSHRNTAPYTFVEEVDFTELAGVRERVQPMAQRSGARLTYLPLVMAAVSMALREHPELNGVVDAAGDLLLHRSHHIGVAVHTEEGLLVPVVRDVDKRNLLDLAREIERLSQAARSGSLTRAEVAGGTFTISSLGPLGGVMGTPMLNTPQVAIVGVHRITPRAVVRDGAVVPRQMANLSFTLDHRYIDGYVGAQFAETLKKYLEDPALMLFWLAEMRGTPGQERVSS